jgi:hypothetical protein
MRRDENRGATAMKRIMIAVTAALLAQAPASGARGEAPRSIDWTISPTGEAGKVQFAIRYSSGNDHSHVSRPWAVSDLAGLGESQLASDQAVPVRFRLAREAGTLDCEGTVRRRRGTGECSFAGDPAFAAALQQRGIGRADRADQFHLALHNIGIALIDELDRQGYGRPSVNDLVALGIHGADLRYLQQLDAISYRAGSAERLVEMRIHGVSPEYLRELRSLGPAFANVPPEKATEMRIHGVSIEFIRELAGLGYRGLGPSELVAMRIHGVKPAVVRELAALGYDRLTAHQLTQIGVHGVSPDFIRGMRDAGYSRLSIEQLVEMRIHGVNPSEAREINAAVASATPQ